ncbi:hypothetical protein [Faecalibacterium duncaniae]|uniref:hypothetical protein n=1 Tax=Faecalibacterium duncaniae (strain DSM 17677 / JCM 31915 / A2-165) TaxID=411483 RepID=UPI002941ACB6|nr:hypothetical protein [Faecalibacterium duncaniae]MDV5042961.1 hypothetical protein [Faecalibacterium duncaniae]
MENTDRAKTVQKPCRHGLQNKKAMKSFDFTAFSGAPNNENPNLFSIGEGFGFFVFFGNDNSGSFPMAMCPKPYQKKDRITKVTTVKVP